MNNVYMMPIAVAVELACLFGFGLHIIRRLALLQAKINYLKRSLQLLDFYQAQMSKFLIENQGFVLKELPDTIGEEVDKIDTGF